MLRATNSRQAADKAFGDKATDHMRDMFLPGNGDAENAVRTPLSGAMFCSNKCLFDEIYKTYKTLDGSNWTVRQVSLATLHERGVRRCEIWVSSTLGRRVW